MAPEGSTGLPGAGRRRTSMKGHLGGHPSVCHTPSPCPSPLLVGLGLPHSDPLGPPIPWTHCLALRFSPRSHCAADSAPGSPRETAASCDLHATLPARQPRALSPGLWAPLPGPSGPELRGPCVDRAGAHAWPAPHSRPSRHAASSGPSPPRAATSCHTDTSAATRVTGENGQELSRGTED